MMFLINNQYRTAGLASLLCTVLTFFLALMTQGPEIEPLELEARSSSWRLPSFYYQPATTAQEAFLGRDVLWGLKPVSERTIDVDGPKTPWVLHGLVVGSDQPVALISMVVARQTGRVKVKRYREGDALPNGVVVVTVNNNHMVYNIDGEEHVRYLYPRSVEK